MTRPSAQTAHAHTTCRFDLLVLRPIGFFLSFKRPSDRMDHDKRLPLLASKLHCLPFCHLDSLPACLHACLSSYLPICLPACFPLCVPTSLSMPLCLTACFHSSLPFSLQSWDHKQSGCFNTFLRGHVNISIRAFIFSFFPPSFVLVGTKSSFLHLVLFVLPLPIFLPHPSLPLYFSPLHQVCLLVFLLLLLLHLSLSVSLTISPCLDSLFVSLSLTNNNFRVSNIRVSNRTLIYNVCPEAALT